MRVFLLTMAVFLIVLPQGAQAATCYSRGEAEAEQGIRIHSELMVIGLNCQHMFKANGKNLYSEYRRFTSTHAPLFASYEQTLIDYFKRNGERSPESSINALRTQFANKISNDAARMRPDLFCRYYAGRIAKVSNMGQAEIRKWASTFHDSHPVSRPVCASGK